MMRTHLWNTSLTSEFFDWCGLCQSEGNRVTKSGDAWVLSRRGGNLLGLEIRSRLCFRWRSHLHYPKCYHTITVTSHPARRAAWEFQLCTSYLLLSYVMVWPLFHCDFLFTKCIQKSWTLPSCLLYLVLIYFIFRSTMRLISHDLQKRYIRSLAWNGGRAVGVLSIWPNIWRELKSSGRGIFCTLGGRRWEGFGFWGCRVGTSSRRALIAHRMHMWQRKVESGGDVWDNLPWVSKGLRVRAVFAGWFRDDNDEGHWGYRVEEYYWRDQMKA